MKFNTGALTRRVYTVAVASCESGKGGGGGTCHRALAVQVHAQRLLFEAHAVRLAARVFRVPPVKVADDAVHAPVAGPADLNVINAPIPIIEVVEFPLLDVVREPLDEDARLARRRPALARPVVVAVVVAPVVAAVVAAVV
eukprot:CAMPEP_0119270084 /NCGR_PEP_ID=MMETSP1329-20130426/7225_1 /TAXON_ID=114041 /ORGANISM="Genus nov. species nov., Strain RCC1024" /LENGTH=140 /DNA_ID=CAMNT_0007270091 /DNA_START=677 /DNA_END=1095 /DNA_ORIENTATION=-